MKDFVDINEVMKPVSHQKIDQFITIFNNLLLNKKNTMNSAFDRCPVLNDFEFEMVVEKARENGYELTRADDNYQTTTYTLKSIGRRNSPNNNQDTNKQQSLL